MLIRPLNVGTPQSHPGVDLVIGILCPKPRCPPPRNFITLETPVPHGFSFYAPHQFATSCSGTVNIKSRVLRIPCKQWLEATEILLKMYTLVALALRVRCGTEQTFSSRVVSRARAGRGAWFHASQPLCIDHFVCPSSCD